VCEDGLPLKLIVIILHTQGWRKSRQTWIAYEEWGSELQSCDYSRSLIIFKMINYITVILFGAFKLCESPDCERCGACHYIKDCCDINILCIMLLRAVRSWHVHRQVQERLRPSWYQSSTTWQVPENLVSVQLLLVPQENWPAKHTGYTHYMILLSIFGSWMFIPTLTAVIRLKREVLHAAWYLIPAVNTQSFWCLYLISFMYIDFYSFYSLLDYTWGTRWRSWLRHCATNRKVAGSIPDGVTGIFQWLNPSGRIVALGSTQPLIEMSTRNPSWG
jgi:hypothetical protein